jgi:3-methylcrotonyl-CoA carboxylase alpha subunit
MAELMAALTIRDGERRVEVRVEADGAVSVGDARFDVTPAGPGLWTVRHEGHTWQVAVAGPPHRRWVTVDGQVAVLDVETMGGRRRRSRASAADAMMAPMPATVASVNVGAGQTVTQGEVVLVLEAMKMELPVRAPRDGVVRAVRCTPGELVQPGAPLVEFDE